MSDRLSEIAREHFERGQDAFARGEYRDAIEAFTKAISFRPDVAAAFCARAAAFRALHDRPSVIRDLSEAIRILPADAQVRAERAQEHYLQKNYAAAIEDCEAAMQLDPGRADVYGLRAACHGRSGNTPMAMLDYEVALRCDPDRAHLYHVGRARLHHDLENWPAVIDDCTRAIEANADHLPAYELRGMAHHHHRQFPESERDFRHTLDNDATNLGGLMGLALSLFEQKRWAECLEVADELILHHPQLTNGYELHGMCRENLGQWEEAIADFTTAIELNPGNPLVYHFRAGVRLKQGEWKKAVADHLTAFHKDPDFPESMNYLAWIWACCPDETVRNGARALEFGLRSCEKTDFAKASYLDTLAACHAELGQWDQAVACSEKAVALETGESELNEYRHRLDKFRRHEVHRLMPKERPA
jgi:tetratricopeptide (TPR) repeat protein